jgi:hypothetical protein
MKRWPFIVMAVAAVVFVATACAPPPPPQGPAAWYDATADTIHYDDASMARTYQWYGQPGVDWIVAHEEGHRTIAHLRSQGIDIDALMPGATGMIREEQAAQCEASAALGHPAPWQWNADTVAAGYWDCPAAYVALAGAA